MYTQEQHHVLTLVCGKIVTPLLCLPSSAETYISVFLMENTMKMSRSSRRLQRLQTEASLYRRETLLCPNCSHQIQREEVLILESCGHSLCEACIQAADSDGEFQCPLCVTQIGPYASPNTLHEMASTAEEEESSGGRNSIPARTLHIINGSSQEQEPSPRCPAHPRITQDLYCLYCEQQTCKTCAHADHRLHRIQDLTDVVHELRHNILPVQNHIHSELLPAMRLSISQGETYKNNLNKKLHTLKELVEQQAKSVIKLVDDKKARTMEELEQIAAEADRTMKRRIDKMRRQMQALESESEHQSEIFELSESEALITHRHLRNLFGKNRNKHFDAFFWHNNKSAPDFNVMATLTSDDKLPKELFLSVKCHIGTAIKCPSAIVKESKRSQVYPLVRKAIQMQRNTHFPKHLMATKKLIKEWNHFATQH